MVTIQEVDYFDIGINTENILEEKFTQEKRHKEATRETLSPRFIVHAHKLSIVEFKEIKKQELERNSTKSRLRSNNTKRNFFFFHVTRKKKNKRRRPSNRSHSSNQKRSRICLLWGIRYVNTGEERRKSKKEICN